MIFICRGWLRFEWRGDRTRAGGWLDGESFFFEDGSGLVDVPESFTQIIYEPLKKKTLLNFFDLGFCVQSAEFFDQGFASQCFHFLILVFFRRRRGGFDLG